MPRSPAGPGSADALRVLVVDDEKNLRLTVAEALVDAGFTVETAASAGDALRALEAAAAARRPYAAVALDLRLPDGSGQGLLEVALRLHPATRVVVMTAYGDAHAAVEALKAGAADFLEKPFAPAVIREAIWRAIAGAGPDAAEAADYDGHVALAVSAVRAGNAGVADAHARRALALDPVRPEAHNALGVAFLLRLRHAEARQHFRAALAVAPGFAPAARNLRLAERPSVETADAYAF